jgi:hypothetical protein
MRQAAANRIGFRIKDTFMQSAQNPLKPSHQVTDSEPDWPIQTSRNYDQAQQGGKIFEPSVNLKKNTNTSQVSESKQIQKKRSHVNSEIILTYRTNNDRSRSRPGKEGGVPV